MFTEVPLTSFMFKVQMQCILYKREHFLIVLPCMNKPMYLFNSTDFCITFNKAQTHSMPSPHIYTSLITGI